MALELTVPASSETVDISSIDHTFTLPVTAIFVGNSTGADATVVATLQGDATSRAWGPFPSGNSTYLLGCFKSVTKSGTTSGLTLIGCVPMGSGTSGT
jgi:hypothetical protein